jgi:hypothetical protein
LPLVPHTLISASNESRVHLVQVQPERQTGTPFRYQIVRPRCTPYSTCTPPPPPLAHPATQDVDQWELLFRSPTHPVPPKSNVDCGLARPICNPDKYGPPCYYCRVPISSHSRERWASKRSQATLPRTPQIFKS